MSPLYRSQSGFSEDQFGLGRRLYRIFLLSILFGVLWVKGYLWLVFTFALLLYLFDTIIIPVLAAQAIEMPEPDAEPEPAPEPPSRRGRSRWKWNPEDTP